MKRRGTGFMLPLLLIVITVGFLTWPQASGRARAQLPAIAGKVQAVVEDDLLDQVLAAGELVVATDNNYAPWSYLDDYGDLVGFDVDVAHEVASRLGVDLTFVTPDWSDIIAGNWGAQWDVSIGSMSPTDDRALVLWFTAPYHYDSAAFAVHSDNSTFTTVDDLSGKKVGVRTGSSYEQYLSGSLDLGDYGGAVCYPFPTSVDIVAYSTDQEALMDLALGDGVRLDAAMTSQATIYGASQEWIPVKFLGAPAFSEPLIFALDQARGPSDQMLAALNAIIAEMHADCTLSWISIKWLGMDVTYPCPAGLPVMTGCNPVFLPAVVRP